VRAANPDGAEAVHVAARDGSPNCLKVFLFFKKNIV